jgi:hypothetical protein
VLSPSYATIASQKDDMFVRKTTLLVVHATVTHTWYAVLCQRAAQYSHHIIFHQSFQRHIMFVLLSKETLQSIAFHRHDEITVFAWRFAIFLNDACSPTTL